MEEILPSCRLRADSALALGRGIVRLHRLETALELLAPEKEIDSKNIEQQVTVALPVSLPEVEKRLPASCGLCDPRDWLCGEKLRWFCHQDVHLGHVDDKDLPRSCYRVDATDERELRRLLVKSGYATLLPQECIATRDDGRLLLGGLFMVEDRPGKHRLIFDKRQTNAGEIPLRWLALPMGAMFSRIRLSDDQLMRGSGSDLDSFFNRLRQHESALPRAGFGRQVSPEEAAELGFFFTGPSRMAVKVIGMGGLNSPAVAQETHLAVLRAGGVDTESFLRWGHPMPAGPLFVGVFYDDLVVAYVAERSKIFSPVGPDATLIRKAMAAYDQAQLPTSASKGFGFAGSDAKKKACLNFTAWGSEVRSEAGLVGTQREKRLLLLHITLRVVMLGKATGAFLRRLGASFVHPWTHRRELFSIFHRFHKFRNDIDEHQFSKLPPDILDELVCAAVTLPIAQAHLRWPVSTQVTCSDATPTSDAFVACGVSQELASSLYDTTISKGRSVPLGPSLLQQAEVEEEFVDDEAVEEVVSCLPWEVEEVRAHYDTSHVNLRELDGLASVPSSATRRTLFPSRLANGSDSLVGIGAWAKGRSPAFRVNSRLRKNLHLNVIGRKALANFKVATKYNPADDPTRNVPLRAPSDPPEWLNGLTSSEPPNSFRRGVFINFRGGACRECFAGTGGFSRALGRAGCWVEPGFEAHPRRKVYIPAADLDRKVVRDQLLAEIRSGFVRFCHFGLPCKGWASANRLNGGTRRKEHPDGIEPILPRERTANVQGAYVVDLCIALAKAGSWFVIENPRRSDFWRSSSFNRLQQHVPLVLAHVDMCAYDHRLPGAPAHTFCCKATSFCSNILGFDKVSASCPGISAKHQHETAWGSRNVNGIVVSLAKAAGAYPDDLCDVMAQVVSCQLSRDRASFLGRRGNSHDAREGNYA